MGKKKKLTDEELLEQEGVTAGTLEEFEDAKGED